MDRKQYILTLSKWGLQMLIGSRSYSSETISFPHLNPNTFKGTPSRGAYANGWKWNFPTSSTTLIRDLLAQGLWLTVIFSVLESSACVTIFITTTRNSTSLGSSKGNLSTKIFVKKNLGLGWPRTKNPSSKAPKQDSLSLQFASSMGKKADWLSASVHFARYTRIANILGMPPSHSMIYYFLLFDVAQHMLTTPMISTLPLPLSGTSTSIDCPSITWPVWSLSCQYGGVSLGACP